MNLIVILLLFAIAIIVAIVLIRRKKDQGSITLEGGRKILVQPPRFKSGTSASSPDEKFSPKINEGFYDISTNPGTYYLQEDGNNKYSPNNLIIIPPEKKANEYSPQNNAWVPIINNVENKVTLSINFKRMKYYVDTIRIFFKFKDQNKEFLTIPQQNEIIITNEFGNPVSFNLMEKYDNLQDINDAGNYTDITFDNLQNRELFRNINITFMFNSPTNFNNDNVSFAARQIEIYGTSRGSYKINSSDIKRIIPYPNTFVSTENYKLNIDNLFDQDLLSAWVPTRSDDNEYNLSIVFNKKINLDKIRIHHRLPSNGYEIDSIYIFDDKMKAITNEYVNGKITSTPYYKLTEEDKKWVGKNNTWIDIQCDYSTLNRCFIIFVGNNRLNPIAVREIEIFGKSEDKKPFPEPDGKQVIPNQMNLSIGSFENNNFQTILSNSADSYYNPNMQPVSIKADVNKKVRIDLSFYNPDGTKKFMALYKIKIVQKISDNPLGYGYGSMQLTGKWDNKIGRNSEIFYAKKLNVPPRFFNKDYTQDFKEEIKNLKGFELEKKLEKINFLRNPYIQRANNLENINNSNKKSEVFFQDFVTDRYEYNYNFQQIIDTDFIIEFQDVEKLLTFYQIKIYAFEVTFPYYDTFMISRNTEIKDKNSPCFDLYGREVGKYLTLSEIKMWDDTNNEIDVLSIYDSGKLVIQMMPSSKSDPGQDNNIDADNENNDLTCRKKWKPFDKNEGTFMHTCYDFPKYKENNKSSLGEVSGPVYTLLFSEPIKVSRVMIVTKPPLREDSWKKDLLSCAMFSCSLSDKNSMPNSDFNAKIIKLKSGKYIGIDYKDGTTRCVVGDDDNCFLADDTNLGKKENYDGPFGQVKFTEKSLKEKTFAGGIFKSNTPFINDNPNFRNWYTESSRIGKKYIRFNGKNYPMQYFPADGELNSIDTLYKGKLVCINDNGSCKSEDPTFISSFFDITQNVKVCSDSEMNDPFNVCFEGRNKIIRNPTYEKFSKMLTFEVWQGEDRNKPENNCDPSAPCARNYYYFNLGVSLVGNNLVSGIDNGLNLCLDMNETRTQENNSVYFRPCVPNNVQQLLNFRKMKDEFIDPNDDPQMGRVYDKETGECLTKNEDGVCEAAIPLVDKIYSGLTSSCLTKIGNRLSFLPCLTRNTIKPGQNPKENPFRKNKNVNIDTYKNQRFYYDGKQIFFNPNQGDDSKDCSIIENQEKCECLYADTNDFFKAKIGKCNPNDSRQVFYKLNANNIVSDSINGISSVFVSPNYYDKTAKKYYYIRLNQITADLERFVVIRDNDGKDIPFLIDFLGEVRGLQDIRTEIQPGPYTMEFSYPKPSTEKIEAASIDNVNISMTDQNYGIVWNSLDSNTYAGSLRRSQIDPLDLISPYYVKLTDDTLTSKGGNLSVYNAYDNILYTIFDNVN